MQMIRQSVWIMANSSVSFKYIYTYYLNKQNKIKKTCVSEIQDALGEGICSDFLVCLQFLMFKKMNGVRGGSSKPKYPIRKHVQLPCVQPQTVFVVTDINAVTHKERSLLRVCAC